MNVPSPMVKTRPVSWTSPPRDEPEMRDSRMEETSDAAAEKLGNQDDDVFASAQRWKANDEHIPFKISI